MSIMSDFEIRANNIKTAIEDSRSRVTHFGYDDDAPTESVSRVVAMFITYLTTCEEARHIDNNIDASFSRDVLAKLPEQDDPSWGVYIQPIPTSSLKKRVESLWGVRVAFTHGDGNLSRIKNARNKRFAEDAPLHLPGVSVVNGEMTINESVYHVAIYGEKPNHTFTYVIYSWDLSEYESIGKGFWCCSSSGGIFSDLATVKSEAKRELGLVSN
jgi:hypothetical protein